MLQYLIIAVSTVCKLTLIETFFTVICGHCMGTCKPFAIETVHFDSLRCLKNLGVPQIQLKRGQLTCTLLCTLY